MNSDKVPEVSEEVLTSRIGFPGKPEKVRYYELLEYLASHYPEETQKYIQAILDNVTSKDVLEMLSEMEELPPEYIEFGTLMFSERRKTLEKVLDNIKSKKEKPSNITPPIFCVRESLVLSSGCFISNSINSRIRLSNS